MAQGVAVASRIRLASETARTRGQSARRPGGERTKRGAQTNQASEQQTANTDQLMARIGSRGNREDL